MRVLITVPWGERLGGAEEMLWTAITHLDGRRLQPTLVFLGSGPFEREVAALGVPTAVIPSGRLREPRVVARTVRSLAAVIRDVRPDLLLNWSPKAQLYGSVAARLAELHGRVVWWQHGVPDGHWMDRLATVLPAAAVGCSSAAGRAAQTALLPRRRAFVVHPGLALGEPPQAVSRQELGVPAGRTVVGIVGRLQPWKGQDRLLRAIAELRRAGHDVHGLVVGGDAYGLSPDYAASLHRLVDELRLGDAVTMTGQVPDALPYVRAMDVLVNASHGEPFGIVLLEAMALGVPVVAVASGGPLEIIEDGASGLLVPDAAPATLAGALGGLVVDAPRRRALGAGGRARYASGFAAERMVAALERELTAVVEAA